ncbi:Protein SRC2 [Bienertia sinuspersici]
MEFRTLDLTILSANDLRLVTHFSRMAVYVVVSVMDSSYNLNSILHKQKTAVDRIGGKNPKWNYTVSFTVNDFALQNNQITVIFQIFNKRFIIMDKLIGEVRVTAADLLSGGGDRKQPASTLSYQVRKSSGQPKGVLNFTCKVGEKFERVGPPPISRGPTMAYPYPIPPQQQQPQAGYGHGYGYPGQRMGGGRNNFGMGLGAGLLGGALGGMLIGDMMSDAAFDGGYDGGFDGGGFDF